MRRADRTEIRIRRKPSDIRKPDPTFGLADRGPTCSDDLALNEIISEIWLNLRWVKRQ
jgi:hypothetical protein